MKKRVPIIRHAIYFTITLLFTVIIVPKKALSQIQVSNSQTVQTLVNDYFAGDGVIISNITYTGQPISMGSFTNANTTNIGMDAGTILSTGSVLDIVGPNSWPNTQTNTLGGSDPQLAALLPGYSINDAAAIEFDFTPLGDTLRFKYVFASEEYPEWIGSGYNDVLGFFITGANPAGGSYSNQNMAIVPGTTNTPLTITSVNNGTTNTGPCVNCQYYINNVGGTSIEFDGFTTVLTAWILVTPCTNYHIKLAIGDGNDHSYDSGVFLEKESFRTNVVRPSISYTTPGMNVSAVEGCNNAVVSFTLGENSQTNQWVTYSVGGTATNGIDYTGVPDSIYIAAGVDSVGFTITPTIDGIAEGTEFVELIVKIASCNYDTLIIPINDYNPIDVHISGDSAFCYGDSSILTANIIDGFAPYSLQWSTNDTNQQIHIAPTISTSYIVNITDGCGITNADTALVTVYNLPNFIINASQDSICPGDSALLVISGGASFNWTPIASITPTTGDSIFAFPNTPTTYTAIGLDSNTCRDTAQITINIKTLPNIQLSPSIDTICRNDSVQIIATGGVSYQWTPTTGISNPTGSSVYASPNNTTIYVVKGTGANSCLNYDTTSIIVESIPNVSVTPTNPTICIGNSVSLTASGAITYSWTPTTSLSSTNTDTTTASPTNTITYFVEGIDANNCSNKDTVTVTVASLPTITVTPQSTSVCHGDSAMLIANGAHTYLWSPIVNPLNNNADSVYASPIVNTTYTVIGTDSNSCVDSTTVNVSVSSATYITTNDSILCFGDTTTLTANIASGSATYLWSNNGATTASITINPTNSTYYHVTATTPNGCITYDSMEVVVNPNPNLVVNPNPVDVCLGDSASVTASGALNYSWTPLTNNSSPNSATTSLSPTVSTTYTVIGSDANSCLDTVDVPVNVHTPPTVNVSTSLDTICMNTSTTLNASGASTYTWTPSSGLSSSTGATVTASPSIPTNYIVIGTDTNSCTGQDTISIFVSPVLYVTASPNLICMGDSTLLTVTSNVPSSFVWSTGATDTLSSFWVQTTTSTTYSVTATTASGCTNTASVTVTVYSIPTINITPDSSTICKGNSVSLTASGAQTYAWTPNSALSTLSGATVIATPNSTSTFYVAGTDQYGCYNVDSAIVYIDSSLTITANPTTASICIGDSIEITSTGTSSIPGAITYSWSPTASLNTSTGDTVIAKPNATQIYQLVGTASNACTDTVYSTITVNSKPTITVNPDSAFICSGDSIHIIANGATSYNWYPSASLSSSNLNNTYASPLIATTYTIVGENQFGCKDSTTSFIGVDQYPVLSINHPSFSLCPNDSVLLSINGANTYSWSPNIGLTNTTGSQNYVGPDSSQLYTIVGSSLHGCTDTITSNITVSPIPVISGIDTICKGDTATLSVISNDPNTTFTWSNGANGSTINVIPNNTTTYTVTASVGGCTNDTSFTVVVDSVETPVITPLNPSICPGDSVLLKVINLYNSASYSWNTGGNTDSLMVQPTTTTTYTVTVSLPNTCSSSKDITVNVYNDPLVQISTSTPLICKGDTAYLSAQNGVSYLWTGNNLSNTTGPNTSATPSINSLYEVTGLSVHNCVSKDTITIALYPSAQINLVASQSVICDNDTAHLTASGAASFAWSPNYFISSTSGANVSVYPPNSQTYSVIGVNQDGCKDTTSLLITVNHGPTISIYPDSPLVCQGDTMLLVASGAASYVWSPLTSLIGSTNDSVFIHPSANIIYYVTGTDSIGCTGDTSVYVNVKRKPFISVIPILDSICDGDSVNLLAHGAITYSWNPSSTLSNPGPDSVSVTATPSATTTYTVIGTSSDGCYKSATATIHVYPNPIMQVSPSSASICFGNSIPISVSGANNYQWTLSASLQLNANSDTAIATPTQLTSYRIIGDNQYGCIDSVFSVITVNSLPNISIIANDTIICDRDSTLISVNGANTYAWSPATGLSSTTGASNYCSSSNTITYHIIGSDLNNCIDEDSIKIEVLPSPTISISASDTLICSGDFISLTGISNTNNTSFLWSNGANTAVTSDSPTSDITYKVVGTDPNTCNDSAEVFVQVNPYPILSVVPQNAVLCFGDTLSIISNCNIPNLSYVWSNGASSINISVNPLVDSVFTLIVSDSIGCSDTASSIVDVVPNPTVNITATDTHICANAQTTLTANASTIVTYAWNTGNPTMTNTYYPPLSTTYSVLVTDTNNCTASDSIFILVNNQPQLQIASNPNSICIGDTAQLSVSSNIPTLTYLWNTGATTTSISAFPTSTTNYTVVGTDSLGCNDSTTYNLVVHMLPQLNITPDPAEICRGNNITLQLNSNIPINQYQWSNSSTQSNITVSPINTTSFSVIATDTNSCVDSTSRVVIVHDNPTVNITATDTHICANAATTLTANANTQVTYSWNMGNPTMSNTYYPALSSTYTVLVTDTNNCISTDSIFILVNNQPQLQITSNPNSICIGDTALLSVSSNIPTLTYLWNTGATTTSISAFPTTTTSYSVVGTDSLGCNDSTNYSLVVHMLPQLNITPDPAEICRGNNITLQLNSNIPISQYQWSNSSTQSSITVSPSNTSTYSVIATDTNSCVDSTSRIVTVHDNPIVNITPQVATICENDSIQLISSFNITQAQILWNTGASIFNPYFTPTITTNYSVIITDSNGCMGYDTSLVNVTPNPTCTLSVQSPICSDDSSLVQYSGTATAAATTNWFFDGANVLSGSGIDPHYLQWTNMGTYHITLSVTENACTSRTDTAEIIVYETPIISISAIDTSVCDSLPIDFISSPSGMASYHWEFGDPLGIGKDTANIQNPSYIYRMPGIFGVSLLITSSDGCSAYMYKSAMVEVFPSVQASFTMNPPLSYDREPNISFTDQSSTPTNWYWDFDDIISGTSNNSNLKDPFHIYSQAGTYQPRLTVSNSYGCSDTAYSTLIIYEPISFYIPNAFTPDGDGRNDFFKAKGMNFDENSFHMYIYNRWGKLVFQTNDFDEAWDGNDQKTGIKAPSEVYSYVIRFHDNQGNKKEYTGSITLIR